MLPIHVIKIKDSGNNKTRKTPSAIIAATAPNEGIKFGCSCLERLFW